MVYLHQRQVHIECNERRGLDSQQRDQRVDKVGVEVWDGIMFFFMSFSCKIIVRNDHTAVSACSAEMVYALAADQRNKDPARDFWWSGCPLL